MIAEYAKRHNICLNRNMALVVAGCAGLAMFMFDRKMRRKSAMMAAVNAFATASATFAAINCATQKAVSEAVSDVRAETKAVTADVKGKAAEVTESVTAQSNGRVATSY